MKVVQTELSEEEYRLLKEQLEKENMSVKEGVRRVILEALEKNTEISPEDPFFEGKAGSSGKKEISERHDEYLH